VLRAESEVGQGSAFVLEFGAVPVGSAGFTPPSYHRT